MRVPRKAPGRGSREGGSGGGVGKVGKGSCLDWRGREGAFFGVVQGYGASEAWSREGVEDVERVGKGLEGVSRGKEGLA